RFRVPARAPPAHPPDGGEVDRRVSAGARRGGRRDDQALERAQAAGSRLGTAIVDGLHGVSHGAHRGFAVPPAAASLARPMKRHRVLVLMHSELMPPDSLDGHTEQQINVWKTEYDVVSTLRAGGHEVRPLGVQHELKPIRDEIESWKPDVVFNLLEQFHGEAVYDQNVASYLELLRMPYTGCNPRGLVLARGKDLSKKLLIYHRIP